jgi:hypothetical protein
VNTVIKHSRHNNGPGYEVKKEKEKEKEKRNEEIPYQSLIEHTHKRFDSIPSFKPKHNFLFTKHSKDFANKSKSERTNERTGPVYRNVS